MALEQIGNAVPSHMPITHPPSLPLGGAGCSALAHTHIQPLLLPLPDLSRGRTPPPPPPVTIAHRLSRSASTLAFIASPPPPRPEKMFVSALALLREWGKLSHHWRQIRKPSFPRVATATKGVWRLPPGISAQSFSFTNLVRVHSILLVGSLLSL